MAEIKIKSVKYNFIMNFVLTASSFIFPFITFPYISRVLGVIGNGKVAFASSIANYFLLVASLGIPTYGIRACASVRNDKIKLSKTVHEILIINIVVTILSVATFLLSIFFIPKLQAEKTLLYINALNIILSFIGVNWFYQALEQYDYITIRSLIFKVLSIIFMFILVKNQDDYIIYGAITVFAAAGSNILNFIRLHKFISFERQNDYEFKKHFKPIFVLFAQNIAVSVYTNLDVAMLGFMKGDAQVGLYSVAVKLKVILLSLVTSLGNVLLPRMSFYITNNMKDQFIRTMVKAINFTLFLSLPLTVYFILFSKDSILLLAGSGYLTAVIVMQCITISIIPNGLTGVLGVQVMTPMGKEKFVLISVIIGACTNIVLNLFLIPFFGATGAAIATSVTEFVVLGIQVLFIKDLLKHTFAKFNFKFYIFAVVCSSFSSLIISNFISTNSFLRLAITSIVFFSTYIALLFFVKESIVRENILGFVLNKFSKKDE